MRCLSPRTVGFKADGKTISWSQKQYSKEFATFQLPCGQCLECRLEYARQWAVRCVHEAKVHDKNAFITLTYSDENLKSPKLEYRDFQLFMKKLRKVQNEPIGYFVTGEYGDKTKRPHWHAILFNYDFPDNKALRTNERGDRVYTSETLNKIWSHGMAEIGSVTFESAGYCARYAAKKLCHGKDSDHDYHPISKKSSKHAIGKKYLEKFWPDIFRYGYIILPDGQQCSIPRYYEKWFENKEKKEMLPNGTYPIDAVFARERWRYVTETKQRKIEEASSKSFTQQLEHLEANSSRGLKGHQRTRNQARRAITESKFKQLQSKLKL